MSTWSVHTEIMNIEIGNDEGRPMKEKLSNLGMLRIMQKHPSASYVPVGSHPL
ncbi:MAG: hypothetical protein Q4E42_02625 [Phascolarctobacterium sp.]|nr:hypothetical protein [Phascolarctobacterium sp.]